MTSKRVSEKNLAASPGAGKPPSTRKAATSKRPARSKASPDSSISSTTPTPVTGVAGVEAPHEPIAAEAIAALAYSYWVARGCAGGSPEEDWIRAERELRGSLAMVAVGKATA